MWPRRLTPTHDRNTSHISLPLQRLGWLSYVAQTYSRNSWHVNLALKRVDWPRRVAPSHFWAHKNGLRVLVSRPLWKLRPRRTKLLVSGSGRCPHPDLTNIGHRNAKKALRDRRALLLLL